MDKVMMRDRKLGHVGLVMSKLLIFMKLKDGQRWSVRWSKRNSNMVNLNIYILISYIEMAKGGQKTLSRTQTEG